MTTKTIVFLSIVTVTALAWASWMFRYQALNPTEDRPGLPPILDRWTGEVLFMGEWWPLHGIEAKEAEMEAKRKYPKNDFNTLGK